jgi:hypothetical protein
MNRPASLCALVLLLVALPTTAATPLVPGQFAQGFAIEAPPGGAIHRLALDERVYRTLQRSDLGDLVVFNGSGEAVPQAFEPAAAPAPPAVTEHALAFYPMRPDEGTETRSGLAVTIDTAGAVVSINAPAVTAPGTAAISWIVDAGTDEDTLHGLRLQWAAGGAQFARPVTVYTSADLLDWQYLVQGTLAALEHGGHRLRQDTLVFHGSTARFLRIDWGESTAPVALDAVFGRREGTQPGIARNYVSVRGYRADTPAPGWQFDSGGPLPVDRLRVQLPGDDDLVELRVLSMPAADATWIERGRALAYRLDAGGTVLESAEIVLPLTRDRMWRIEPVNGDTRALGDTPEILLGWSPESVLFVARGSGPYTLAAGSATGVASTQPVASLLSTLGDAGQEAFVSEAWLGAGHVLGGDQALVAPRPPVPWQRYLMWALLVAGVLVMLRMALSLLRPGT